MPRHQTVYLVVRSDGEVRVAKRPRIAADEIAVAVNLTFPDGWGLVTHRLDVQMPDPPTAEPGEQEPTPCGQDPCEHAPDGGNHPAAGGQ